jgi:hypothetical protein
MRKFSILKTGLVFILMKLFCINLYPSRVGIQIFVHGL